MIERWVRMKLVGDPRTARWFGQRVTPIIAVQGETRDEQTGAIKTFATWKLVSTEPDTYVDLTTPRASVYPKVSIAIEIFAETYEDAKAAAAAVRGVLHLATGTRWGSNVFSSLLVASMDDVAVPVDGKGVPLYSVVQTYEIRHEETL